MEIILKRVSDQEFEELPRNRNFVDEDGNQTSYESLLLWTPQALAGKGLYKRVVEPVPDGKRADGHEWVADSHGRPQLHFINLQDTPAPGSQTPASVQKLFLLRALRATNKKGTFDAVMARAGNDLKEDWAAASMINRNDPITLAFIQASGETEDTIDSIFRLAEQLRQGTL